MHLLVKNLNIIKNGRYKDKKILPFWFTNMPKRYYAHVKIFLLLLLKCIWNHAVLNNCLIVGEAGVSWNSDWRIWKHAKSIYWNATRRECWKGCCESLILTCHLKQNIICCRTNQCNAVIIMKETYLYMYLIIKHSVHTRILSYWNSPTPFYTVSLNVQTCYMTAMFSSWFVFHMIKKFLARFGCQRFIAVVEKCLSSGPYLETF